MKAILMVIAFVFTLSLVGSTSNVSTIAKSQTENLVVSQISSSSAMKSGKSKKANHKKHKRASGSKKTKK